MKKRIVSLLLCLCMALALNGTRAKFSVDWTAERGVFIETDKPYSGI